MSTLLRLWFWFSLRPLLAHPGRTATVLAGIALGAAVFTSVRLAVKASVDSFTAGMDHISGKAQWTVVMPGGQVPDSLVAVLLGHPVVNTASPVLSTYVRPEGEETAPLLLLGFDPILDRPLRSWQTSVSTGSNTGADTNESKPSPAWLDFLAQPFTLVAGEKVLQTKDLHPGGTITLIHPGGRQSFRILAALKPEGLALAFNGELALTDIATFQEFTGRFGLVDRIDLLLRPGVTDRDLVSLRALLPPGVILESPAESRKTGLFLIRSYGLNLSVLSFVSLFVGMFLVFSLVTLHATARRGELAILRSVGASAGTVFSLFLAEGLLFGVGGWILALPLSSVLVTHVLGQVSSTISHLFVQIRVEELTPDTWELIASFTVTVGVSLSAALQPAWEATKVRPREALARHTPTRETFHATRRTEVLAIVLLLLVWPLAELPGPAGIPLGGYGAAFCLFSGFALLAPGSLRFLGRTLPPWLRRIGGQPAYLGGRSLRDSGARVAISVGALITAMALLVALTIMVQSFRRTVELWVSQSVSGDLFLRPRMAEFNQYREPLPEPLVATLQKLEPHVTLSPYRRLPLKMGKVPYQLEAIDFERFARHARLLMMGKAWEEIEPALQRGEGVIVSEVFSNQTDLHVGHTYRAWVRGIELRLPILGVFRDYRTQGGLVHYSLQAYQQMTGDTAWSGARLFMRGATADTDNEAVRLRRHILDFCSRNGLAVDVTLGEDLRNAILRLFDETFAVTSVLLLIALVVATLGITTTLTVLVLERARHFQTLLALGASRGQLRAMIIWEALLMILTGEVVGIGCGFLLSALLIFVINRHSFGWTFLYHVDWVSLLGACPLILATALVAALPACRLIFKQTPAKALRE